MTVDLTSQCLSHPEFRGRVGLAQTAITPPEGIYARLWGSAKHDVADGVHRPMLAKAMVLQADAAGVKLVLVTLDAVALWQEEADRIRGAIIERLRLSPEHVMIHPSHTHSSPMLARRHADRPGGDLIAPYLDSLPQRCAELAATAEASLSPGVLSWAYGVCALAFNRDAVDGPSGRGVCGLNLDRAADHTLLVGRISDASGAVRGVIVNYACHPVSLGGGNRLISPDYVGPMRELIERETGATCLFLHGASGDLTPRRSYESTVEAAERNGRELGFAALATLGGMLPPASSLEYQGIEESGTALGVWRSAGKPSVSSDLTAQSALLRLALKDLPSRETIVARMQSSTERYELERLERMLAMKDRLGTDTAGSLPVTVWRVGEAFLVATAGEPYSRYQVELRRRFPASAIAVLNLTNGATSYLPEASAYERDNYPARVTEYAAGCLEQSIEQTATIMERMAGQ
jgi:Neutral/alkaline non-lysosomal ceramidase, N-terminal